MSYAMANVIYGIDLTDLDDSGEWRKELPEDLAADFEDEPHNLGLEQGYSGSGPMPLWLGIGLCGFDECNNFRLDWLVRKAAVTEDIKKQWEEKVASLDPRLHTILLKHFGVNPEAPDASGGLTLFPEVLVIWGSS